MDPGCGGRTPDDKEAEMAEPTCALWYWSHHSLFVELCESEQEAAESAVRMVDFDEGAPAGIQFADGRYVDREDWVAYEAEHDRRYQETVESWREAQDQPKPATRSVTPPFDTKYGETATVLADAPSWLGRQVAPSSGEQPPVPATPGDREGTGGTK